MYPKNQSMETVAKKECFGNLILNLGTTHELGTNVIPKQMGYAEMVSGYRMLHNRLLTHRNIADRMNSKT